MKFKVLCIPIVLAICVAASFANAGPLVATHLRVEWLPNPVGIDVVEPRLSWQVESEERGEKQTAYRILVASDDQKLKKDVGDLWDTGIVSSGETLGIPYHGKPLVSGQRIFWKVQPWNKDGMPSGWSETGSWSMGLLLPEDWQARWISFEDHSRLHTNRETLYLPPAHHYRKEFKLKKPLKRATVYASALGIFKMYVNGQPVGDAYFEPGWSDYHQRAYYRTHDVTEMLEKGTNVIGAVVADGWYSGYLGFALLLGDGPNQAGRYLYGKTPALLAQLDIEYTDGSREIVITDPTWKVTETGPFREADIIMGETYDARAELAGWAKPGFNASYWPNAIRAEYNGSTKAVFHDKGGNREVELGFRPPFKLQAYPAQPVRVTQELKAQRITEPKPGVYIFDFGQNFAGIIRLRVQGAAGTKVQIRYGEHLYPDGHLMTENLRRARATDYYILRGDPNGEVWSPQFTYHGFQYAEVSGLPNKPELEDVTGLVLQSDTPRTGSFACSDEVLTHFAKNAQWTQRANFMDIPTDCPQRDERFGWMGDAQTYVRTATFNADVAAFFTKWLDDVEEAQRDFGAYPDYCPYPVAEGNPDKTFGTAWTDAGVICPWTIWRVYGDTRVIERHWASMSRFMDWRAASMTPEGLGTSLGNGWGDWLNVNDPTPIEFIDTCYHALDCKFMADMADAIGRKFDAANYRDRFKRIKAAFKKTYVGTNGTLKADSQTAYVLALWTGLVPDDVAPKCASTLAEKIARNGFHMTTGFLGTRALLPTLSANGQHDLAVRLFQSRQFPSWGYEVVNGATSVWERWDSYTQEHGFEGANGKQNAAMNSFSHYSFGAVMEWAYRKLAGIDTEGAGYKRILIKPGPPFRDSDPYTAPVNWVTSEYLSARGRIAVSWKKDGDKFDLDVSIPANTTAEVFVPAKSIADITEGGHPLSGAFGVSYLRMGKNHVVVGIESGEYHFVSLFPPGS